MEELTVLNAMQDMLFCVLISVCLLTIPVLIVGLIFSVLQAATQINEMTMTFIPKFITMFTMLFILAPWLMERLVAFMEKYMQHLSLYIR